MRVRLHLSAPFNSAQRRRQRWGYRAGPLPGSGALLQCGDLPWYVSSWSAEAGCGNSV